MGAIWFRRGLRSLMCMPRMVAYLVKYVTKHILAKANRKLAVNDVSFADEAIAA